MPRLDIDVPLVQRLIATQFPQWAHLPIRPVDHNGWDNRTFHLGSDMAVRLPSAGGYVHQVAKEHRWLPILAKQVPLPIPVPLERGVPGEGYPFAWSVYGWIDGVPARKERIGDLTEFATALAGFLNALKQVNPAGGPEPGAHNSLRGGPLRTYDQETRDTIEQLGGLIPAGKVTEIWAEALAAEWDGPPVWFHGDVAYGNLLLRDGRLAAVIDFGTSGVGDPSCDLAIAWTMFEGRSRSAYRECLQSDPAMWARGRGWALWKALITYDRSRYVIEEIIAEYAAEYA